jgi:hypothetical protein
LRIRLAVLLPNTVQYSCAFLFSKAYIFPKYTEVFSFPFLPLLPITAANQSVTKARFTFLKCKVVEKIDTVWEIVGEGKCSLSYPSSNPNMYKILVGKPQRR